MRKKSGTVHSVGILGIGIVVIFGCAGGMFLYREWQKTIQDIALQSAAMSEQPFVRRVNQKPARQTVKGIYLTAYTAGNPKRLDELIALIDRTELNAVVIDIKDYSGYILYDSELPVVNELQAKDNRLGDFRQLVKKLHDHDIYVMARQTVFQDPLLAERKPEWAIRSRRGGLWHDQKGLTWVDPTRKEVWDYNIAIARDLAQFDIDEINFDYVRFPSDGNMSDVVYTNGSQKRHEVMRDFYQYLNTELASLPVLISLDMFGFVMERGGNDDLQIGQRLEDAVDEVDYISPMMYPSHYPPGHLGLENPAAFPTQVWQYGFEKGMPRFVGKRAEVRPWVQAFTLGAVYDGEKIRAQIAVTEKYSDAGWLLWNASNRYTDAGLMPEESAKSQ